MAAISSASGEDAGLGVVPGSKDLNAETIVAAPLSVGGQRQVSPTPDEHGAEPEDPGDLPRSPAGVPTVAEPWLSASGQVRASCPSWAFFCSPSHARTAKKPGGPTVTERPRNAKRQKFNGSPMNVMSSVEERYS